MPQGGLNVAQGRGPAGGPAAPSSMRRCGTAGGGLRSLPCSVAVVGAAAGVPAGLVALVARRRSWPPPYSGRIRSGSPAGRPSRVRTTPLRTSARSPFARRRTTRANVRVEPGSVNDAIPSVASTRLLRVRHR